MGPPPATRGRVARRAGAIDLSQKLHEALGGMIDQSGAARRVGVGGVAADAIQVEILALPAEADLALRRQIFELLRHFDAEAVKFAPLRLPHQIGTQMKHHGCFDSTAMNAVLHFGWWKKAIRQ